MGNVPLALRPPSPPEEKRTSRVRITLKFSCMLLPKLLLLDPSNLAPRLPMNERMKSNVLLE
jgi:hypothetical protein